VATIGSSGGVVELIDGALELSRRPKFWVAQARPPEQTTAIPTESKPRWSMLARCPSDFIQPTWSWLPMLG
jgi:hypothetical protein